MSILVSDYCSAWQDSELSGRRENNAGVKVLLPILFAAALHGQTFEVASVKPAKGAAGNVKEGPQEKIAVDPGSLTMRSVTLRTCIQWAYSVADYQISGPAWLALDRYDIQAKAGTPASPEQLRGMLRALLASRFGLTLHRETRDLPVYELVVGRNGAKLKPAAGDADSEMRPNTDGELVYSHYTLPEFAGKMTGIPFRVDRIVIDKTGLAGAYDFRLKIADNAVEMKRGFEREDGPTPSDILRQIGLKLEARRAPVESLVVDRAERKPAEN